MKWHDRLPDGMKVTSHTHSGFTVELGLPVGPDGMFPLRCPEVPEHEFGLPQASLDSDDSDTMSCPCCGHRAEGRAFFTQDERRRLDSAMEAAATAYVDNAIDDMFRKFDHNSRGNKFVKVTTSRTPRRRLGPLHSYDVPEARRTMTHETCGLTYAVFGLAVYCPRCGDTAPHEQFAELMEVQRRALSLFDDLPSEKRAEYDATGVITRTYETSVKDTFGALETLLRDEFLARSPDAAALVKGRGNVFQRLGDASALYQGHLGVDLSGDAGDAWTTCLEGMAVRHILAHNSGVIDERYIAAVPAAAAKLGTRINVDRQTADRVLAAATTVAQAATGATS